MTVMTLPGVAPTTLRPAVIWEPIPAPQNIGPAPTGIGAVVGEFSRGLVDSPKWIGDLTQLQQRFGGVTPNPTNPARALGGFMSTKNMALQGVLDKYIVRAASSLVRTAYVTLKDGSAAPVLTIWAGSPGTWANGALTVVVVAGSDGTHQTITVTNGTTGESQTFSNLAFGSAAAVAASIGAINAAGGELVQATLPVVDAATTALTSTTATTGGTILAGVYQAVATFTNANGETVANAEQTVTTTGSASTITWSVSSLPPSATAMKVYMTGANGVSGSETFAITGATSGVSVTLTAPPAASTVRPPLGPIGRGAVTQAMASLTSGTSTAVPLVGSYPFQATGASAAAGFGQGNDGANAGAAAYTGVAGSPNTGANALTAVNPIPDYVVFAEDAAADTTQWLAQAQLAQANGWQAVVCWPQGTTAEAVPALWATAKSTLGAYAPYIKIALNWVEVLEATVYNGLLMTAPHAFLAGIGAVQDPSVAAYNKPLTGVVGTEWQLSDAQCQLLQTAGTNPIVATIPAGGIGFDNDIMADGTTNAFELRMQQYLAKSIGPIAGQFIGQPNSPDVRTQARLAALTFLDAQARAGYFPQNPSGATPAATTTTTNGTATTTVSKKATGVQPTAAAAAATSTAAGTTLYYAVVCDSSNNVVNGVTTPLLYMDIQVQLAPNIKQFVIRAAVGVTVQVTIDSGQVAAA